MASMYELEKVIADMVERVNALAEFVGLPQVEETETATIEELTDPDA